MALHDISIFLNISNHSSNIFLEYPLISYCGSLGINEIFCMFGCQILSEYKLCMIEEILKLAKLGFLRYRFGCLTCVKGLSRSLHTGSLFSNIYNTFSTAIFVYMYIFFLSM